MKRLILSVLVFIVPGFSYASLYFKNQNLKVSKHLQTEITFWEDIFSKYESNHCVYHDTKHLDAIFWVSTLRSTNRKVFRRQIKQQKAQIRQALVNLGKGKKPSSWLERRILDKLPKELKTRSYFRAAKNRVRCQRGVATSFRQSLARSERYLGMIKKEFRSRGLPLQLAYLPHLESGFNTKAKSKVGARGLWQLMPATARQFLKVNRYRDERINPIKATTAAATILNRNYQRTKSWPLAITAYNYGINGVMRAMRKYNTKSYLEIRKRHRTRIFGFAAKNFYPSFVAVKNLALAHEKKMARLNSGSDQKKPNRQF
ncbi:MAG: lytic transglycosylase domain-containing protein [Pseudobacteriovorax sp.]|nr:lytic transglycosylase domain-containing protein [Pseudobacteriovorax sp.]